MCSPWRAGRCCPPPAPTGRAEEASGQRDRGDVGRLLARWYADGTAAGNVSDWNDNRDGGHAPLRPQLHHVTCPRGRRHWGLAPAARKQVTFGNSSTSGPPRLNGSSPRTAYGWHPGLAVFQGEYPANNLHISPEYRDHNIGRMSG